MMFTLAVLKYFFLIFSVIILPVRTTSLLAKKVLPIEQVFTLGLGFFFSLLIFFPSNVLTIIVLILWPLYGWGLFKTGQWQKEILSLLVSCWVSAPIIFIFYLTSGHFYDLKEDTLLLNQDVLWHIGLTASFKVHGFYSLLDPRILSSPLKYHALIHNLWAKISIWSGENLFESILSGSRPVGNILSCWLVYDFFEIEFKSKVKALLSTFGVFFLYSFFSPLFIFNDPILNSLPVHLLSQVTGEEYGFGIFFSGLISIYKMLTNNQDRQNKKLLYLVVYSFSVLMCLGVKVPYGLSLIGILYILIFWQMLTVKKVYPILSLSAVVNTISLLLVYFLYYGKRPTSGLFIDFAGFLRHVQLFQTLINNHGTLGQFIALISSIVLFFGPTILVILYYRRKASIHRYMQNDAAITIGTISFFTGLMPFLIFNHSGFSQLYFAFAAQTSLNFFSWLFLLKKFLRDRMTPFLTVLFSCFIGANIYMALKKARAGFVTNSTSTFNEACRWIRDNSDQRSVVAINVHHIFTSYPRFFHCSAIAERQFFIEGYEYTDKRFKTTAKIQRLLAQNHYLFSEGHLNDRNTEIQYLVYFKKSYGDSSKIELFYSKVFESKDVIVYSKKNKPEL